ncbi:MAG TPA: hypothetical protein VF422_06730 [Dokdonella sp.]
MLAVCGVLPLAHAGVIDSARTAEAEAAQAWTAWGGEVGVRWNRNLLDILGVAIEPAADQRLARTDPRRHEWFGLRDSGGLRFIVRNGALQRFSDGSLQMRGGYALRLRDGSRIDLRDLTLRVRAGEPGILDLVGADGKAWFYTDRLMFELVDGKRRLAIQAADVRMSLALAQRIGRAAFAHQEVADLALTTEVHVEGGDAVAGTCVPYPWPGVEVPEAPGQTYQADLFMQTFSISMVDCLGCDGPSGGDGTIAWAPSSTLRNNVNNGSLLPTVAGDPLGTSSAPYTATVAWYTKFSGNYAPYGNDQHPYLIWNLYRINANGSIEQIGRSGVKHAFLTVNGGCLDSCNDPHILGRGCSDTYGTGNNDSPWDMGPRSEIVPASGIWGRCGSIWDADCNGTEGDNGNDFWTQRMKVAESQVSADAQPGASYIMDSWYLARQDINIYNSMATVTGTPTYAGGLWNFSGQSNYRLGAAIDRWVDPANPPANAMNSELAVEEGHAKVAVKATDLGNGTWRYDYAVMNFDFARAVMEPADGSGPNVRVLGNRGFDSFSVPFPSAQAVIATSFSDGSATGANPWVVSTAGDRVSWSAPAGASLDWGTLYSFSLTVAAAPTEGMTSLRVAEAGTPASYDVAALVPQPVDPDDVIFDDGFEMSP